MTNPTSNFGWQMPTPTDLVTDLPADFEVFGQAVDTTMADLKGGTTGQILSKATNTDMDFTWITNDVGDITAVNVTSPVTGGGSSGAVTIGVSAASTSASGVVQLSDSTSTTSSVLASTPTATKSAYDLAASAYAPAFTNNFYAGKNKIINADFGVWQRGTTFTNPADSTYTADRWQIQHDGTVAASRVISQQTFTPGTAPVTGYEGTYFLRYLVSATGTGNTYQQLQYNQEDVKTFANQTVTVSFWAKADAARTISVLYRRSFGTGGSTADIATAGSASVTTSWARYSVTYAVPSVSGKTIGANSFGSWVFRFAGNTIQTIDIWGVQVEAGSTATPFQTASGSIGGELALCQRYYFRNTVASATGVFNTVYNSAISTTHSYMIIQPPVPLRTGTTAVEYSSLRLNDGVASQPITALTLGLSPSSSSAILLDATIGTPDLTTYRPYFLQANASASAYIGFSAEL